MPKMQDTMNITGYYRESIRPHDGPEFDQAIRSAIAAFWQDGHDTALINGQSSNPYRKDTK